LKRESVIGYLAVLAALAVALFVLLPREDATSFSYDVSAAILAVATELQLPSDGRGGKQLRVIKIKRRTAVGEPRSALCEKEWSGTKYRMTNPHCGKMHRLIIRGEIR
jgi:hypothetical protein